MVIYTKYIHFSIIDNKMQKLENLSNENSPYFNHLYHLTLEKIRKVYHRIIGIPKIPTSKVHKIYTDEPYRILIKSKYKKRINDKQQQAQVTSSEIAKLDKVNNLSSFDERKVYELFSLLKDRKIDKGEQRNLIKKFHFFNEMKMKL